MYAETGRPAHTWSADTSIGKVSLSMLRLISCTSTRRAHTETCVPIYTTLSCLSSGAIFSVPATACMSGKRTECTECRQPYLHFLRHAQTVRLAPGDPTVSCHARYVRVAAPDPLIWSKRGHQRAHVPCIGQRLVSTRRPSCTDDTGCLLLHGRLISTECSLTGPIECIGNEAGNKEPSL